MMKTKIIKTIFRILLVSLYAILVLKLVKETMPADIKITKNFPQGIFPIAILALFNLNTEGNLIFNRFLNKKLSWFNFPKKRLIIQLSFILMWTIVTIGVPFTIWYFYNGRSFTYPPFSVATFVSSIVLLLSALCISLAISFFKEWRASLLKAEHYKQEKLKAEYRVLQNQMNPHFLFNSLNVLISEIRNDPIIAEKYTRKLSKVYRYVLQNKNQELINLQQELDFIHSYIFLHKVRVGEALSFTINIVENAMTRSLPPLSLQILVENAIKHNVITEDEPLTISINSPDGENLVVENNLNPKKTSESTNTGLENIQARYAILGTKKPEISINNNKFIVSIPLINQ